MASAALTEYAAHRYVGILEGIAYPAETLVTSASAADVPSRFPLAAKLQSPQVLHKTEVDAVQLGLADAAATGAAVEHLLSIGRSLGVECDGVLLQSMVEHDLQLIVGLRWDPVFGPVLLVGRGGTEVEADRDVALRVLPVGADEIESAIRGLRVGRRLAGSRGRLQADLPALARAIDALCMRFLARRDLAEIEINPLALRLPATLTALDMLVRLTADVRDETSTGAGHGS